MTRHRIVFALLLALLLVLAFASVNLTPSANLAEPVMMAGDTQSGNGTRRIHRQTGPTTDACGCGSWAGGKRKTPA